MDDVERRLLRIRDAADGLVERSADPQSPATLRLRAIVAEELQALWNGTVWYNKNLGGDADQIPG
jgi:hypothetical protein